MKAYLDLLNNINQLGVTKSDRTGVGTKSIFGAQLRFDLSAGFPLVTTKKIHFKSIVHELLWFLSGDTNISYLKKNGVRIWDDWADKNGDLGPIYGAQWRRWPGANGEEIDQIKQAFDLLVNNPDSRRIIVSAWNPAMIAEMVLPPCHTFFQFYVANHKLSCSLYQRSADMFLGVPFNIASYALLTQMMAQQTGYGLGEFIWTAGDCHVYLNHQEQIAEQLLRTPKLMPKLTINRKPKDIFSYHYDDFILVGYDPHPTIKAPVAV